MPIVTRNILYRRPVDFARELPPELVYQVLSYLPARDLKTVRLVNRFLAEIGRKNIFWSDLCQLKWAEKLCLQTIPMPAPHIPDPQSDDGIVSDEDEEMTLDEYLASMKSSQDHTYDELKPYTLHDLANRFPAFHLLEGSWLRAYNLVEQHMQIPYLHSVVRKDHFSVSDTQWEFRFSRSIRSHEPHALIHAFLDYRRDHLLHIVHGHRYWEEPFLWRPLANGSAIRVHEFPPHELDRNSDGYRTMTNQWVCMTSSSEHSFVTDLGMLSQELMKRAGETAGTDWKTGDNILKWIDAYAGASGNSRSCWVGEKKKIVCMTWRDADSSDDEGA